MTSHPQKPKVLFIFSKGKNLEDMRGGYPLQFDSGFACIRKTGLFEVDKLDIAFKREAAWLWRNLPLWVLWRPFERFLYIFTGVGFALGQIAHNLRTINHYDVVLGVNDTSGLPLSLLKRLGLVRPRVIFISAGLINNILLPQARLILTFFRWTLSGADIVLSWSETEREMFESIGTYAEFLPLEAAIDFYVPSLGQTDEDFALSIGKDVGRDTRILIEATHATRQRTKLLTSKDLGSTSGTSEYVDSITEYISFDELRSLYDCASFVIIPLQEISRITGQTTFLEALAMGKPIIAAKTIALHRTYPLEHGRQVLWYEPGNVNSLIEQIRALQQSPELRARLGKEARLAAERMPRGAFCSKIASVLEQITQ